MRIAHTADLHLDERTNESNETLDEQAKRLIWIGDHAAKRGAKLMVCAGDVFERTSTPAERNAAIGIFQSWARHFPVVVIYGNHDRPGDLDYLGWLRSDHQIMVISRSMMVTPLDGVSVSCLPWPRKAWLAEKLKADQDVNEVATAAMRNILADMERCLSESSDFTILLGHVEIGAALSDSGQPMTGKADIELSVEDLKNVGANYCALGHIHKRQSFANETICYAGSPRQTTFGEERGKGYVLASYDDGELQVDWIDAPGHELVTIQPEWDGERLVVDAEAMGAIEGCAVRISYDVDDASREQAAAQAEETRKLLLASGVRSVKLDPRVKSTHRVRSEAIREAKTNEQRVHAWWESRKQTPERAESILAKLSELEGAA